MKLILLFSFATFSRHAHAVAWHLYPQFDSWYPLLRPELEYYIQHNCSSFYTNYLVGKCPTPFPFQPSKLNPATCKGEGAIHLTNCLLQHVTEIDKSFMAGAAILLGLLPTVLSMAASTTVETGVLSVSSLYPPALRLAQAGLQEIAQTAMRTMS